MIRKFLFVALTVPIFMFADSAKIYTAPGVVIGDQGGDNLINLTSIHSSVIEVVGSKKEIEPIEKIVRELFDQKGLPQANSSQKPLPFFHLLIYMQKIPGGYAVYVTGRLFEKISLERVRFRKEIDYQAITWERDEFFITQENSLPSEISRSVNTMLDEFMNTQKT